jgi:serine/threonine-protein kinase
MSDTPITGRYGGDTGDASIVGAILGNYRITAALSSGGMGTVYRAQHELLDRPAAIKLLRPELTANDELVQRFFTEAKAATAIRHPGIIEVYDFGYTEAGHAYIVMEFLEGEPLSRAIAARGAYPEIEAASIARGIASALKAAHAKGIIHRDLKPDNIFIVPDPDGREGRIKVLDFGIAKLANPSTDRRRTQTGVLMGTPKYMAPEQAREAGTIDHRADLYSLGCILYELLAGAPPFLADGAGEVIAMQLFNTPEPIAQRASVTPEMAELVMRLLEKDPARRLGSARDVMEALDAIGARMSGPYGIALDSARFRASEQTRAQFSHADHIDTIPSRAAEPTTVDPPRRSRMPFIAAGLALAVTAATIAFFATRTHDEPTPNAAPPPPAQAVQQPQPTRIEPVVPPPPVVEVVAPTGSAKRPRVVRAPKSEAPAKTAPRPEEPKPPKTEGPKTEKGSPVEFDVGDPVKQPKAPS